MMKRVDSLERWREMGESSLAWDPKGVLRGGEAECMKLFVQSVEAVLSVRQRRDVEAMRRSVPRRGRGKIDSLNVVVPCDGVGPWRELKHELVSWIGVVHCWRS